MGGWTFWVECTARRWCGLGEQMLGFSAMAVARKRLWRVTSSRPGSRSVGGKCRGRTRDNVEAAAKGSQAQDGRDGQSLECWLGLRAMTALVQPS